MLIKKCLFSEEYITILARRTKGNSNKIRKKYITSLALIIIVTFYENWNNATLILIVLE